MLSAVAADAEAYAEAEAEVEDGMTADAEEGAMLVSADGEDQGHSVVPSVFRTLSCTG